jgi:hypothetical protein
MRRRAFPRVAAEKDYLLDHRLSIIALHVPGRSGQLVARPCRALQTPRGFFREVRPLADSTPKPTAPVPEQQQGMTQPEIILIEQGANSAYSNFARVTATHEEVIIDFCLNPNPFHQGRQEINVSQRLIMNFYTAKRLLSALAMTLQRHEQTFGPIELDIRRRVQNQPPAGPATGVIPSR